MNQYVVVTGVSSGIGFAIARELIHRGYRVFGSVRKESDGQRVKDQLGEAFTPLHFDVTDSEALASAVEDVSRIVAGQGLAGLVNNAGINVTGPLMHLNLDEIRALFEVNVLGVIGVTQAFLPLLGAREGAVHRPGRIVNISSVSGAFAAPFLGAYAGTKHALEALTQAFRRELKIYGIEVCAIEPGFIRTDMFEKNAAQSPDTRFANTGYARQWQAFLHSLSTSEDKAASPDIVAAAVSHALTSKTPKTRYPLDPVWWIGRFLPDRVFDRLVFKAMGLDQLVQGKAVRAATAGPPPR
ncbi:SDR family oxidoreductase [Janthinobacterium sp. HLX7-2]|uniref:SDR family oxidoreductase n=1 Tax=Janthinobacterium sp. HLX7-2 TaxID=1259331 RepID=UPI003F29AE29